MSLEAVEAGEFSSPFFLLSSFFSFLFSDRTARIGESGMSLLIEERRGMPLEDLAEPRVLASRSGGGRFTRDGTHAPEKF
jgi:hypothetical protein